MEFSLNLNSQKLFSWFILVGVIIITGCSSNSDSQLSDEIASLQNLTVIETELNTVPDLDPVSVATFGNESESVIGMSASIRVDESGRVFVADNQQGFIHVFGPNGAFITAIGERGRGPGEFESFGDMRIANGYLHVLDTTLMRISRFHLDNFELHSIIGIAENSPPSRFAIPYTYYARPDGSYLMIFTGPMTIDENPDDRVWEAVVLYENEMYADSTLLTIPANDWLFEFTDDYSISLVPPYGRRSLLAMDSLGTLNHGWSEDIIIKAYDMGGEYQRAIYSHYSKPELVKEDAIRLFEERNMSNDPRFRSLLRNQTIPETWPAMNSMLLDDKGRFWISAYTENLDQWKWLILDPDLESIIGTLTWPKTRFIHEIKNSFIYTWETDFESGSQRIVKYRY